MGFPDSSVGKESACNAGDPGSIPGLGWSPGEGIAYPLQYSGLENPRDCTAYAVTKSQTWLSDFHYLYRYTFICYPFPSLSSIYYFPAMHNVSLGVFSHLSPHSLHPVSVSNITWLGIKHIKYVYSIPRLPWWLRCKEFTCSEKDLISAPGLGRFPGVGHGNPLQYSCLENSHGQRSLVGYSPWGHRESDTTEQQSTAQHIPGLLDLSPLNDTFLILSWFWFWAEVFQNLFYFQIVSFHFVMVLVSLHCQSM